MLIPLQVRRCTTASEHEQNSLKISHDQEPFSTTRSLMEMRLLASSCGRLHFQMPRTMDIFLKGFIFRAGFDCTFYVLYVWRGRE